MRRALLVVAFLVAACSGGSTPPPPPPPPPPCTATGCEPCDGGLTVGANDPADAAKAIELCTGLVSVRWVEPDGSAAAGGTYDVGHGILPAFGPNVAPVAGARVLALSTGTARRPSDAGYGGTVSYEKQGASPLPAGFPLETAGCPTGTGANDAAALEVVLDVPAGATGLAFDWKLYTYEYPEWVCTQFNDQFVALLSPPPAGTANGNVAFDALGNPVTVNVGYLDVCSGCASGTAELSGTGFEGYGATGWVTAAAPVTAGERITLRLAIYDVGDQAYDSTVLIDAFRWLADG